MSPIRRQQGIIPTQPVPERRDAAGSDNSATNENPPSIHTFSGNNHTCAVCSEVLTDLLVIPYADGYSHCYNCVATRTAKPCTTFSSCIGPSQTSTTLDEGVYYHSKPHERGSVYSRRRMLESQEQKEKNIVKPPIQLDGKKLFNAIYTSHPVQPSGPVVHPWILPMPYCNTTDYNYYHLLWLLYNRAASEDVGEICPPSDDVSIMVPLSASESQEAFSISLDDNDIDENQNGRDMQAPAAECQICFNGRVQLIFIPCGHGTCQPCSNQLQRITGCCSFCRMMISRVVELR